jgi:hypothetical protein
MKLPNPEAYSPDAGSNKIPFFSCINLEEYILQVLLHSQIEGA